MLVRVVAIAIAIAAAPARADCPLTLADALHMASARRTELRQADLEILRARLALLRAKLEHVRLNVQVSGNEQLQALDVGAPASFFAANCASGDVCRREVHGVGANATLTVPLFSGLQIEADVARAHALERVAVENRRATWRSIYVEVVDGYWTVRRAELVHDLLQHALRRELEIEDATKARVDAGLAPMVDYQRTHLVVLRQRSELVTVAEERDQAMAAMAALLHLDETPRLVDDPPDAVPAVPELAAVEREAVATRAEVRGSAAAVDAAHYAVRAARAGYWPQLSIVGAAGVSDQPFFNGPPANERSEAFVGNFAVGMQLTWTAFDMLTTWMNVRDARYLQDRSEADAVRARYVVVADVRAAWQRLRHEIERLATVQTTADVARQTVEALRRRYKVASAAVYEITAAEDELVAADTDVITTRIAIATADAELRAAVGRP